MVSVPEVPPDVVLSLLAMVWLFIKAVEMFEYQIWVGINDHQETVYSRPACLGTTVV